MDSLSKEHVTKQLELAIVALYREFEALPPSVIEGCPCCIETRGVDVLLTTDLAQLTGDDLWRYTTGTFLTIGGPRDFRYLLPRIFEIAANDLGSSPGAEIVLGKLKLAEWQSWSSKNQFVVTEFIDAWLRHALVADLQDRLICQTESVLCGAAIAGMSLSRWHKQLRSRDALPVLNGLREIHEVGITGFWEEAPEGFSELAEMLN
jgi:hypothetical protein